jgi:imidazole glycerol phosphate synthase glutamine amidotransferase subunit
VAVLDYEAGNLRSAAKALARAGAEVTVTPDAAEAARADALVVPGVGNFGQCVRQFRAADLEGLVQDWVAADRPLLGICVGMQILYRSSDEEPETPGLGILPGHVRRLPGSVTVPHTGWNVVGAARPDALLDGVAGRRCYFNHAYYAAPDEDAHVLATCPYGPGFPCVVRVGACVGTQFHPEKSSDVGGRLLANFVREAARPRVGA